MSTDAAFERARERELADLVRTDYDATLRAMQGFISSSAQIRAIGVATWGVVLGLGVDAESWILTLVATLLVAVFAAGDGYHGTLYRRALSRALRLEALIDEYLNQLGIDEDDPDQQSKVLARLETHRFGPHRAMRVVHGRDLLHAKPYVVFRGVYPLLAAIALVLTLSYGL
jgi:hypothetical protein